MICYHRVQSSIYISEEGEGGKGRTEIWRKPNQLLQYTQFTQTKLKMGTEHKTQCSKLLLFSPLYNMHRWMFAHTCTVMHSCNDINEPTLLHMFLYTQELARHIILNQIPIWNMEGPSLLFLWEGYLFPMKQIKTKQKKQPHAPKRKQTKWKTQKLYFLFL